MSNVIDIYPRMSLTARLAQITVGIREIGRSSVERPKEINTNRSVLKHFVQNSTLPEFIPNATVEGNDCVELIPNASPTDNIEVELISDEASKSDEEFNDICKQIDIDIKNANPFKLTEDVDKLITYLKSQGY